MSTEPADLIVFQRITANLIDAVRFVDQAALLLPTPCAGWTVADLLDHVTGGNRFTLEILAGATADDALVRARHSFGDDHRPADAVVASATEQLHAVRRPGALAGSFHHVAGELTGHQVLRLRTHDLAIHTWDVLQAVQPSKGLDPVYVRWAIDELADPASLTAKHVATGWSGPTKPYELLLAFGRRRDR